MRIYYLIKYNIRFWLETYPELYVFFLKVKYRKHWFYKRIISKEAEIIIEGFPRSANSFAVQAFKLAQPRNINIATHTHSPAQIKIAVKRKMPCLVLIREPEEAITSLKALYVQSAERNDKKVNDIPVRILLKWYIKFYESLLPYRQQFVLAQFNDVVKDFGSIINKVNSFYSTNYYLFEHNEHNVKKIFNESRFHLSPNINRDNIKKKIRDEYYWSENKHLVKKAELLFNLFISTNDEL